MNEKNETKELFEAILAKLETPPPCLEIRREWIPKHEVQQYLGFANTSMNIYEKKLGLVYTLIGKQKFYSAKSILTILNKQTVVK